MDKDIFVQNIKKYCDAKGVKPTIACRESGAGVNLINKLETNGSVPSVERVQLLANYLGVTTSELLGEVPMGAYSKTQPPAPVDNGRSVAEQAMLTSFRQLNEDGQLRAVEYMGDLLASGRYSSEGSGKKPA